jgi:DNA polymerase-3 subunit delta'
MIYPWQSAQWQQLQNQREQQRIPHSILLSGRYGLGKADFAMALAFSLLCQRREPYAEACGQCPACLLMQAGTHPDLLYLAPEDAAKAIKVDDIRGLCKAFTLTSQYAGYKVAIIDYADNMNINAANSLLKTLEEPSKQSIIILVTSTPHRLPVTVRSRCQSVFFPTPATEQASAWLMERISGDVAQLLSVSHGAPLQAERFAQGDTLAQRQGLMDALLATTRSQSVIERAEKLSKWPNYSLLGWVYDCISDLLKLIHCGVESRLINQDYRKELIELSQKLSAARLYSLLDQVIKFRKEQSIPLNSQMLWEDLLISWEQQITRV